MAKAKSNAASTPAETNVESIAIQLPADFAFSAHGFTLTADQLAGMSGKAVAYLIGNGFSQSIGDKAAMSKEDKAKMSEAELEAHITALRQARFDDILNGAVGSSRAGSRGTKLETEMREIAVKLVKKFYHKKGEKLPTGDVFKATVDKVLRERHDDIKARAVAAMAETEAQADLIESVVA